MSNLLYPPACSHPLRLAGADALVAVAVQARVPGGITGLAASLTAKSAQAASICSVSASVSSAVACGGGGPPGGDG